jgi:hypothetical protein
MFRSHGRRLLAAGALVVALAIAAQAALAAPPIKPGAAYKYVVNTTAGSWTYDPGGVDVDPFYYKDIPNKTVPAGSYQVTAAATLFHPTVAVPQLICNLQVITGTTRAGFATAIFAPVAINAYGYVTLVGAAEVPSGSAIGGRCFAPNNPGNYVGLSVTLVTVTSITSIP